MSKIENFFSVFSEDTKTKVIEILVTLNNFFLMVPMSLQ